MDYMTMMLQLESMADDINRRIDAMYLDEDSPYTATEIRTLRIARDHLLDASFNLSIHAKNNTMVAG